ncbi:hypothetical protein D3218_16140 [Aureimonas flava]|uniref:Uncharacterized protein n=2 Tax=Aureimonas flava TaxID=2320271 RepID=A0A3A1WFG4_9HYPH|nr:hypothetical protein D3218_16140 [Aureimonas flava]
MGTQSAGFAYRLARIATGHVTPTYRSGRGSRKWLQTDPEFMAAFATAKSKVAAMSVQYVVMEDDITQALLEIYCAVALQTPHNSFRTT